MPVISGGKVIEGAHSRNFENAGAPTSGTSGTYAGQANPGAVLVDTTNGLVYTNTNTKASPTWALAGAGGGVANVAAGNVIGGIPLLFIFELAAGALADTDLVMTHKVRVTDAWLVLAGTGVATTTLTVKNGATAITDAMAASGADKALIRAATIDDAQHIISAGGTLRVTSATGATQPAAIVYVAAVRVA